MFNDSTPLAVTAVLWILLLFSIASWTVILAKGWRQWRTGRSDRNFVTAFWQATDLHTGCARAEGQTSPLARLCIAGTNALDESGDRAADMRHRGERKDILERTLRQQVQKEQTQLETGLTLLASIGSVSPFIGLFGTVWGIMHALHAIAQNGAAGLDVVAGPVGESLIATAFGIATAIPAVLAYNFYLRRMRVKVAELEHFTTDFLNLSLKSRHNGGK